MCYNILVTIVHMPWEGVLVPTRSIEELLDLLLIGLTYLREDQPTTLARPAGTIYHTLKDLGLFSEKQRRSVANNPRYISYAMRQCDVLHERLPRRELEQLGSSSLRFLIVLVEPPGSSMIYSKLFGPQGYPLMVTEAGMEHARQVSNNYPTLTPETFQDCWGHHLSRIRGKVAKQQTSELG